jgi:hypothetical protein
MKPMIALMTRTAAMTAASVYSSIRMVTTPATRRM